MPVATVTTAGLIDTKWKQFTFDQFNVNPAGSNGYRRYTVSTGLIYSVETIPGSNLPPAAPGYQQNLEPLHLSQVGNGEISELRVECHMHPEAAIAQFSFGQAIQLIDNGHPPGGGNVIIFNGTIVKVVPIWAGEHESCQLVAYGNGDYLLHRICIFGQWRRQYKREVTYFNAPTTNTISIVQKDDLQLIHTPTIFNPEGLPNCSPEKYFFQNGNGNTLSIFDVPFRNQTNSSGKSVGSVPWTLSRAVAYILNFYNTSWAIDPSSYNDTALKIFTAGGRKDPLVSNVNVQGDSLAEALRKLMEPHNYFFSVDPRPRANGQQINFYYRGASTATATLKLSARGTKSSDRQSTLIHFAPTFDCSAVVNTIQAFGERISYTTLAHTDPPAPGANPPVLKLVKGWKDADLVKPPLETGAHNQWNLNDITFVTNYDQPDLISPNITQHPYGVGRLWLVNVGESPTRTLENLTADLADGNPNVATVSFDPRRLEKPDLFLQNSAAGLFNKLDLQVEMSSDGTNWGVVERHWYKILPNSMGIVFTDLNLEDLGQEITSDNYELGTNYWQALLDGELQLRIVCSVKSDERVNAKRLNTGATTPLAIMRVADNDGYRRVIYNNAYQSAVSYVKFRPITLTIDDTSNLQDVVNLQATYTDRPLTWGTAIVRFDATLDEPFVYFPGQEITGIQPRGITLNPAPMVIRTVYDFQNQHVQLTLDSKRVPSILKTRPNSEAENAREAQLHAAHPTEMQGGNQVPFIQGASDISPSQEEYYRAGGK